MRVSIMRLHMLTRHRHFGSVQVHNLPARLGSVQHDGSPIQKTRPVI
jgi:hypothetical protein